MAAYGDWESLEQENLRKKTQPPHAVQNDAVRNDAVRIRPIPESSRHLGTYLHQQAEYLEKDAVNTSDQRSPSPSPNPKPHTLTQIRTQILTLILTLTGGALVAWGRS